jgi:hypothetical protein
MGGAPLVDLLKNFSTNQQLNIVRILKIYKNAKTKPPFCF